MPIYLTADEVKTINQHFLGAPALRDESALVAAMARPLAAAYYQQADLVSQAAILIEGIAQAHAFVDANKRTATAQDWFFCASMDILSNIHLILFMMNSANT
jgi:death-on-curing family protein